ncbi:MAG: hypothetical protein FWG70_03380 [Oscillospiraceae bacterium]|nr:hypothetical protein [Oscillospiraceae bacterium]
MTVKELRILLKSFPEDMNVVVDVVDFGQEPVQSAEVVELFRGMTSHGLSYYDRQDYFMGDDVKKEKVVYLSGHKY